MPDAWPDLHVDSVLDLDFRVLAAVGVRGVLLDVDNTLVRPHGERIAPALLEHLRVQRRTSGIERWALATNARRDLTQLGRSIGVPVVGASLLCAKPRHSFYRRALAVLGIEPDEAAMVGDKVLHDIRPPARLGMRTVLVRPQWPDQAIDRLLLRRRRESRLLLPTR